MDVSFPGLNLKLKGQKPINFHSVAINNIAILPNLGHCSRHSSTAKILFKRHSFSFAKTKVYQFPIDWNRYFVIILSSISDIRSSINRTFSLLNTRDNESHALLIHSNASSYCPSSLNILPIFI